MTLTTQQTAARLGVSRALVMRLLRQERLIATKDESGRLQFEAAHVEAFASLSRPVGVNVSQVRPPYDKKNRR